ncbi:hypothetical protein BGZ59_000892, partial [Podila verticillata]
MSLTGKSAAGTGHVGTLTPDQTAALKKLWAAIYEIQEKGTVTIVPEPVPETLAPALRLVGAADAPVEPVVEPPLTLTLEEIGLTPQELHAALWDNVLCDSPDSLVLRFLRARKWHVGNGLTMILKAFKWRQEQHVEDVKTLGDDELEKEYPKFKDQLEMGKFYVHG